MSWIYWRKATIEPSTADKGETPTTDQHPFPTGLYWKDHDTEDYAEVGPAHPLPVVIADQTAPGRMRVWDIPIVVSTGAYTAADAVGQMIILRDAARTPTGRGAIVSATFVDKADQAAAINSLVLFNWPFTPTADNAAMAISDADAENGIGGLTWATTDYLDFGGFKVGTIRNQWLGYECKDGNLYGQIMTSGTPTYAVGDLRLIVVALLD